MVWSYLRRDRTRTVITVFALSLSLALVFTLTGIYYGFNHQATVFIENSGADLWVVQRGVTNFYFAISFLPASLQQSLEATSGVDRASPLIVQSNTVTHNGRSQFIFYFGYDQTTGLGGPWQIIRGSQIQGNGQMVIDRVVVSSTGADVGSTVKMGGNQFTVVGVSAGTSGILAPYVFITISDATALGGEPGVVNFFLVRVSDGFSSQDVRASILSQIDFVDAIPTQTFAAVSRDTALTSVGPVIQGMAVMGDLTGVLIIGLTNYTSIERKRREFGILKAIGMSNTRLFGMALGQSLAISVIALPVSGLLTWLAVLGLDFILNSPLTVLYTFDVMIILVLLALQIGLLAGFLPTRQIAKIDPAIAFREEI